MRIGQEQIDAVESHAVDLCLRRKVEHRLKCYRRLRIRSLAHEAGPHGIVQFRKLIPAGHLSSPFICRKYRAQCQSASVGHNSQTAARPKNAKNPMTSVTVVTNTAEATAGSIFNLSRASGMSMPESAAAIRLIVMAAAITIPSWLLPNHQKAKRPTIRANSRPLMIPTADSRRTTLSALSVVSSRVASARTATVM